MIAELQRRIQFATEKINSPGYARQLIQRCTVCIRAVDRLFEQLFLTINIMDKFV